MQHSLPLTPAVIPTLPILIPPSLQRKVTMDIHFSCLFQIHPPHTHICCFHVFQQIYFLSLHSGILTPSLKEKNFNTQYGGSAFKNIHTRSI